MCSQIFGVNLKGWFEPQRDKDKFLTEGVMLHCIIVKNKTSQPTLSTVFGHADISGTDATSSHIEFNTQRFLDAEKLYFLITPLQ